MKAQKVKMVVTDLDGTLLRDDKSVSEQDFQTLQWLGENNICRVVATGRTMYNTSVLPDDFPVDYVVFSSGAGILDWHTKVLLVSHRLSKQQVDSLSKKLIHLKCNFNVYKPIPDNHHFAHFGNGNTVPDFQQLFNRYKEYI